MSLAKKYKELSSLSPLEESQAVQKYTDDKTNFGYDNKHDILQDLYNEIDELKIELDAHDKNKKNNTKRIFEELGDVIFVIGNLANRYNINSADALKYSIKEFERRMIYCETNYKGENLKNAPKEEMIRLRKKEKKQK